ncbi:ATP-binding protein [Dactylosporangium sp. NPDC000521]|uniref:ATP-binding protein n=1 Tax=Dactylosporangium sp. NPDC000521 TaxID=3363975 RepID=UPI00369F0ACB
MTGTARFRATPDGQPHRVENEAARPSPAPPTTDQLPQATIDLRQSFTIADLYTLRAAVEAHATADGVARHTVDALLIIVSELATNAVLHGGGRADLTLSRGGNDLVCVVRDHGPGLPDPQDAGRTEVSPSALNGRGLWIVRQLSKLTITTGPDGTTATAIVAAPPGDVHAS